jgi:hypothetical protein
VTGFALRHCCGGWTLWEYIPYYQCPPDHPYLWNARIERHAAIVPNGVSILESNEGIWPIAIAIHRNITDGKFEGGIKQPGHALGIGTRSGLIPNTATQWTVESGHWYKVQLMCTSDVNRGYISLG